MIAFFRYSIGSQLGFRNVVQNIRYLSNKSAFITKIHRKTYLRMYPTLMVEPNGSTYTFRHYEPRKIIKLPVNFAKLTEEEKAYYMEKRKPKKKLIVEKEIEDNFSSVKYLKMLKKAGSTA